MEVELFIYIQNWLSHVANLMNCRLKGHEKTPSKEMVVDKTVWPWLNRSDWACVTRTTHSSLRCHSSIPSGWLQSFSSGGVYRCCGPMSPHLRDPQQVTSSPMNGWTDPKIDLLYNGRPNQVSLGLMKANWFLWHVGFHTEDKCVCVCVCGMHSGVFFPIVPVRKWD